MYHQKVPSYDGAQPFIYAVYCKEDEAFTYPVLARMYNEGFRVCCAPATGISSDYYTQQRLAAAANVIMFMSQQMAERLRTGDPEVIAAARSPLVRTVVQLDDADVKNSAFAMAAPDHEPYRPENDSAFWLYIYSNDYFDCCRGPWPEKKLLLRDPVYEDISEEVVSEEYRHLENIMSGTGTDRREYDPFNHEIIYENNAGYIKPEPDEFSYVPLERIEAVRTEHDDQMDEVLELITQAEDSVAAARRRSEENARFITQFSVEENAAADAADNFDADITADGSDTQDYLTEASAAPADESKEQMADQKAEAEPKADLIVTPQDIPEKFVEPEIELLPEEPECVQLTEEESAAAAEVIIAAAETISEELPECPDSADTALPEERAEQKPESEALSSELRRSSVPVMARMHSPACKVRPVQRRVAHAVKKPAAAKRAAMHLSAMPLPGNVLPPAISDSISFEQYVRNIARSVVTELPSATSAVQQDEPAPPARKHRGRAMPAAAQPSEPESAPKSVETASAVSTEDAHSETRSARKNRYPHQNGGVLNGLINALRQRRSGAESDDEESRSDAVTAEITESVSDASIADISDAAQETEYSVPVLDPKEMLQSVIDKFIEINSVPARMVVPRTVRRYRD